MRNRYLLGAGVALAMAFSWGNAQAQLFAAPAGPGAWYFGGEGGWTSLENQGGRIVGLNHRQSFRDGYNVGARAGYEWGPWRFEEEFNFKQNGQNRFGIGALSIPVTGNRNAHAIMTNAIYDFNIGWALTPHIGAGVGAVILHDAVGIRGVGTIVRSTDLQFGYQGIAGIRYNINPSLAFDLDYRYLATTDPTFRTTGVLGGVRYSSGYSTHNLTASLSVRFGAPPPPVAAPPVPPAPPPLARKVFLVFFDWDKDTITPEGMQIIQQAAAAFRAGAPVTIQVTGYTDRSGSPGYNQRLSERRANNVANALSRMGVPRQQMAVSGRGENDNRVPTADGVREPQNRRVEIVFP
jgi:outer membrane protein OmpA-like peptidoglycan-associated protein